MIKHKSRFVSFSIIASILLLCFFNAGYSVAAVSTSEPKEMNGGGGQISVENDTIAYGAIVPDANSYSAMYADGYYQAQFDQLDWDGDSIDNEDTTAIEGKEINGSYPMYFDDDTGGESSTVGFNRNNGMIDPWNDINWLKVDSREAENATRPIPFNFTTTRNWYCMGEDAPLLAPISSNVPMQIDIKIDSVGPKILKYEYLGANAPTVNNNPLISPSGKAVNRYSLQPQLINYFETTNGPDSKDVDLFNYWGFVACETGTYTLWFDSTVAGTNFLSLEFMDVTPTTLEQDTLTFGGSGEDDVPNWQDVETNEWSSVWYSFEANAGEIYKLDLASKYTLNDDGVGADVTPQVNIFTPCCSINGYAQTGGAFGSNYIYVPEAGKVYVAIDEDQYFTINRYSMYLQKIEQLDWTINATTMTVQVNTDQVKALKWTMANDSFVRINYTGVGSGAPAIYSTTAMDRVIYKTAPKENCFQVMVPPFTKYGDYENTGDKYLYFYLPAGQYVTLIRNTDTQKNGFLRIDSKYIKDANKTIEPVKLGYPYSYMGAQLGLTFDPDVTNPALKYGQWFELNITKRGIYRLNTTVYGSGLPNKASPSKVITVNNSLSDYHDLTTEVQQNKDDEGVVMFDDEGNTQYMYIGYANKWTDLHFNFTDAADAANGFTTKVWSGSSWDVVANDDSWSTATNFNANGSIWFNHNPVYFRADAIADWDKGADTALDNAFTTFEVDDYYWMRIEFSSTYSGSVVRLDHLMLSNITMDGDLNMYLVKDSPYQYCDFWGQTFDVDDENDNFICASRYNDTLHGFFSHMASAETDILNPMIYEPGMYKLLVVPAHWSVTGPITVNIALEDLSGWVYKVPFNLTKVKGTPGLHTEYLTNGKITSGFNYNYTTYPFFGYNVNTTFTRAGDFSEMWEANAGIFLVNVCCGNLYNWTTLVYRVTNVSAVRVYLIYDLPWINNNGPNSEWTLLDANTGVTTIYGANKSLEFGALDEDFMVAIVFTAVGANKDVWVRFNLFQWNTTKMTTVATDLYTCEPVGGAGDVAIPGYPLYLMLGGLMAVSAILVRKKLKTARIR